MLSRLSLGTIRTAATEAQKFTVHPAIKRQPTDLLQALSETVGVDQTAPHFSFIDDPLTIPSTATAKRNYFLAKEMGKRAARELATEWPTLFAFDRDQPRLPVFRPEGVTDPLKIDPTEKSLVYYIENREVNDAVVLYERLRSENVELSESVQLNLFRLVAYYNNQNVPFAEWNWPGMRNYGQDESHSKWKNAGVADLLFETLPQTTETTSILIAALCKYPSGDSVKRAKTLLEELISKKSKPYREAFDAVISVSTFKDAQKLLSIMSSMNVKPTDATWSALVKSAAKIQSHSERINAISEIIGEVKACGSPLSLEMFHNIAKSLIDQSLLNEPEVEKSKQAKAYEQQLRLAVGWLAEMVGELENQKSIQLASPTCNLFFNEAMAIAYRASNIELARRIVALYESEKNLVKMPAFTTEAIFYNRYLQLFIERSGNIQEIEKLYKSYVPRLVGVSKSLTRLVLGKLKNNSSWSLLQRVILDAVNSKMMTDNYVSSDIRLQLIETLSVQEREQFSNLVKKLTNAWIEFSRFTEDSPARKRMQMKLNPASISESALLLTRIGEEERAYELLELILDDDAKFGEEATVTANGYARPNVMAELFEDALRQGNAVRAAVCLEIMSLNSNKAKLEPLAKRIHERCRLTPTQSRLIDGFVRLRPQ